MTEPTPSITDAALTDIATNGIWGDGLTPSASVVAVAEALLAALRGEPGAQLPTELAELVAGVRETTTAEILAIDGVDDVRLSALAIRLRDGRPHPVVVVPAGWNPYGWMPFLYMYLTLARRGYHVLAYTPRGIGDPKLPFTSDGFINVAGEKDWADGSAVIDFAQGHFSPSRIGFLGLSYGSGISQLVAAHDEADRVSTVVAVSTWGNLATSLYDNGTRHLEAVRTLIGFTGGSSMEEKFDEETQQILKNFLSGQDLDTVVAWGTKRSPQSYTDITNERGIPTYISNTWHETLFPVGPVIDTFEQLTVPKHLNLWIGDHGAPEGPGMTGLLQGLPFPGLAVPMREAYEWLDHHLLGVSNDVPTWPTVNNQSMFTYRTARIPGGTNLITVPARREPYASWKDVTTSSESWYLTGDRGTGDGALTDKPTAGWSRDFTADTLTEATAVDLPLMKTGQQEWFGNPKIYDVAKFERDQLLVWSTDPLTGSGPDDVARRIRGAATVKLTVHSTTAAATLVAYLYDIAPDGTVRIITHEPYTATGLTPNADSTISWQLQAASYDLPSGHRLALVVNGRDQLYSYANADLPVVNTITISSQNGSEAGLELPLG
ncbi:CocE/NonD family hydrolase [Streptomyces sp. NPDC032161]|uniref:CocE/NonD family hydrolase n=1 Tax=unclassified Streptomyces TaxID=2593676 RepID=UPI0033D3081F